MELKKYTTDQVIEAATIYAVCGSYERTAEQMGIPRGTVSDWRNRPEWIETYTHVLAEHGAEIRASLVGIMRRATENMRASLLDGEEVASLDKQTGVVHRYHRAPSLKDTAIAFGIAYDKHAHISGRAAAPTQVEDRLQSLADRLEALADKSKDAPGD